MKIVDNNKSKAFGELLSGDVFMVGEDVYMKIDAEEQVETSGESMNIADFVNAVDLMRGESDFFNSVERVKPMEAELYIR